MIRNHIAGLMASTAGIAFAAEGQAKGPQGAHTTTEVDTGSGQSGFSGSISMDVDGDDVQVSDKESTVDHIEVGAGTADAAEDGPKPDADDTEGPTDDDEKVEGDEDDTPPAELPEFKADDPEVIAVYDKTFKSADGKLNMEALSREWWGNAQAAEDGVGHLSEGAYAYLDHLGIPKEMVQSAEAGQQALNTQSTQVLYNRAGGKANLDAAIAWAANGDKPAYTDAQQAAFNAAIAAGGEKAQDAIDLLMSRHEKASGRRTSPQKSAGEHGTQGQGSNGGSKADTFANRDEWITARKEAGRDVNKQAAVSRRFRNSPGAASW